MGVGRLAEEFCWLGLLLPLLLLVAEEESEPVRRDSQCLPFTTEEIVHSIHLITLNIMEAISFNA